MITANQIQEQARRVSLELPKKADVLIANAAEAEPLMWSTAASIAEKPVAAVLGMRLAMLASDARFGIFAVRSKAAAQALSTELRGAPEIQLMRVDDRYFADDPALLRHLLGAPQASMIDAAMLLPLARLLRGETPTAATLSVVGAVQKPSVIEAPLGTSFAELARWVKAESNTVLWSGGPMRGRLARPDETVQTSTKTLLALPSSHPLLTNKTFEADQEIRRVSSVCGGCRMCAELCPPRLLGSPFDPQKALLALAYGRGERVDDLRGAMLCSGCGVCERYVCPVGLRPASLLQATKAKLQEAGITAPNASPNALHVAVELRQIPLERLATKLGVSQFAQPLGPIQKFSPSVVRLPLYGGIPLRKAGDRVQQGEPLSAGQAVYASITGTISEISPEIVTIVA
jgi:Na+-translocating ferredoxin:NAD+ oxidoreductase RnfC subunit